MSVLQSAEREKHETARNIVENQITAQNFTDGTFIPNPESAIRLVNRHKAKKCPKDPTFECKIRLSCIDIEDSYLIGDCKIEENGEIVARHLIFATDFQLEIFRQCSTIYMDGTFKCVRSPFEQLFSIHAFLRCGENIKQIPLGNIVMFRRKKKKRLRCCFCTSELDTG